MVFGGYFFVFLTWTVIWWALERYHLANVAGVICLICGIIGLYTSHRRAS